MSALVEQLLRCHKRTGLEVVEEAAESIANLENSVANLRAQVAHAGAEEWQNTRRMTFLHTTNKDSEGYEYGIAKVKHSPSGHIESFLWALGDNSDLDAAMDAAPAKGKP
jgi:hypothetical protein